VPGVRADDGVGDVAQIEAHRRYAQRLLLLDLQTVIAAGQRELIVDDRLPRGRAEDETAGPVVDAQRRLERDQIVHQREAEIHLVRALLAPRRAPRARGGQHDGEECGCYPR
jgi:hypothetical protein